MNLRKWLSISLALGLMVALCPLNALAWPNRPSNQQYHRGYTQHQPRGNAYGWHGQRPPMYQHHRPQFNRQYGYQQQNPGYQYNQGPWMSQGNNSGYPSGPSGLLGLLQSFSGNSPYNYTNGQNTSPYWGQNQNHQQGQYNHRRGHHGGTGSTPPSTITAPPTTTRVTPRL